MASTTPKARFLALAAAAVVVAPAVGGSDDGDTVELTPLTIAERSHAGTRTPDSHVLDLATDPHLSWTSAPGLARQLSGLPGVVTQESFGGFDPPRISMRGSGLQSAPVSRGLLWTLDGLPLNASDGSFNSGVIDLTLMDAAAVDPVAATPDTAAHVLGGGIRLYSPNRDATARAWVVAGEHGFLRAGATGPFPTSAAASGATGGTPEPIRAGLAHASWDGWRAHSEQRRTAALVSVGHRWRDEGPRFAASVYATDAALDVPGPLTRADALGRPRSISAIVAADQPRRETTFVHASAELSWDRGSDAAGRIAVVAQHTDDWFRQLRANGISDTRGTDLGAFFELSRNPGAHHLDAGLWLRAGRRDQQRWTNVLGAAGTRFSDLTLDATHVAGWVVDAWQLTPALALHAGGAFAASSRESLGSPDQARGDVTDSAFLPRASLHWTPADDLEVFIRAARASESPTFDDLLPATRNAGVLTVAWTPLRHQTSTTLELGCVTTRGPLTASLTFYDARWDDELLRLADASGASRGTVNAAGTRHSGLESAVRLRLADRGGHRLDLAVTHAWSRAVFDQRISGGRHLAGLPPHAGAAHLSWSESGRFSASVSAHWIGGTTWADHANRLGYSGHVVVHARAGCALGPGWQALVEVDNCLDRRIIASTSGVIDVARDPSSTALFLPGMPRQVRIGLTWTR